MIKINKLVGITHTRSVFARLAGGGHTHPCSVRPSSERISPWKVGLVKSRGFMMRTRFVIRTSCASVLVHFSVLLASAQTTPEFVNQGPNWTAATRADFYSRDQGSRMIPLAWRRALKQANGQPFLADSLARYGYLPNPANSDQLPVGFTASGPTGSRTVGMTCAACHTRQITVEGKAYRID